VELPELPDARIVTRRLMCSPGGPAAQTKRARLPTGRLACGEQAQGMMAKAGGGVNEIAEKRSR